MVGGGACRNIGRVKQVGDNGEQIGAGYRVRQFVEKPDRALAEAYLACGEYAWNSGMFLMRASHYLEELTRFAPAIAAACRAAMVGTTRDLDFVRVDTAAPYRKVALTSWIEDCAAWCAG